METYFNRPKNAEEYMQRIKSLHQKIALDWPGSPTHYQLLLDIAENAIGFAELIEKECQAA